MDYVEKAMEYNRRGFNCSQSVFAAFAQPLGIDEKAAGAIATNLGTGCRTGNVCGAVSGALMALGLYEGHTTPESSEEKDRAYEISREFVRRFEAEKGTTVCSELLGGNPSVPEDRKMLRESGKFSRLCPSFVELSASILQDYLEELGKLEKDAWK